MNDKDKILAALRALSPTELVELGALIEKARKTVAEERQRAEEAARIEAERKESEAIRQRLTQAREVFIADEKRKREQIAADILNADKRNADIAEKIRSATSTTEQSLAGDAEEAQPDNGLGTQPDERQEHEPEHGND